MFQISANGVDVWQARLDLAPTEVRALATLLSPAERERAARFRFDQDQRRFIVARGELRRLLGLYCGNAPEDVEIDISEFGKPFLVHSQALLFNVAHSGERAAYIMARRIVGIDVELMRPVKDAVDIASLFFAKSEYYQLRDLSGPALMQAFLRLWTLKEAYVKAKGIGFGFALGSFSLPMDAEHLRLVGDPEEAARWQFAAWTEGGYVLAVAAAASVGLLQLRTRWWQHRL